MHVCMCGAAQLSSQGIGLVIKRLQVRSPLKTLWCCCCFLEQETLLTLLQSTQLLNGYLVQTGEAAHPAVTSMGTWCKSVCSHCGALGSMTPICETSCGLLGLPQEDLLNEAVHALYLKVQAFYKSLQSWLQQGATKITSSFVQ